MSIEVNSGLLTLLVTVRVLPFEMYVISASASLGFELRGVTPVLQSEEDTSVPRLPEQDRLEIDFHPVQILAIVRTRDNRLQLADLGEGEIDLPQDVRLLGVLPASAGTFEVTAYDSLTDENNKLGYHFNGTVPGTWVDLAQSKREAALAKQRRERAESEKERRQATERAEQEAKAAQKRRDGDDDQRTQNARCIRSLQHRE